MKDDFNEARGAKPRRRVLQQIEQTKQTRDQYKHPPPSFAQSNEPLPPGTVVAQKTSLTEDAARRKAQIGESLEQAKVGKERPLQKHTLRTEFNRKNKL
ncbi:hypothetical protein [uncultured Bradyrhizobium sp.]|uniref:hypothetical protein n=1 Tax=uncultured Bradyrhizobium sp. TaxID=199684 RepID=UPI0035C9519C